MPNYFPHDVIIDILTRLSVKSLLRFKSVCKLWHSLIEDGQFIKQHYETRKSDKNCEKYFMVSTRITLAKSFYYYTMDPPLQHDSSVSLVDPPIATNHEWRSCGISYHSSNGMLLLIYPNDTIILWNPAIRESRKIHSPVIRPQSSGTYNFCYFPSIDGYKIFRLGRKYDAAYYREVHVFSTKGNSWKSIGRFPPNYLFAGDIVISDGIVYIMARRKDLIHGRSDIIIVRFCLEKEQFQEELLCPYPFDWTDSTTHLFALEENLSLTNCDPMQNYQVWHYMKTNGLSYSWSKIFAIKLTWVPSLLIPVSFMKNGDMLFLKKASEFVVYNSRIHKFEEVNVAGIEKQLYFRRVVTYVETLFSPNS